jgi:hypothetical protein
MGQQMSYLQDQAMAAAGYKKSGKDQEAALDKALKSADYLASRGADGIAALKDLCKQKKVGGTTLPKGWQQKIPLQGACMNSHMNTSAHCVESIELLILSTMRDDFASLHAIEQTRLRRQHRVDGLGRLKYDFHTGPSSSSSRKSRSTSTRRNRYQGTRPSTRPWPGAARKLWLIYWPRAPTRTP